MTESWKIGAQLSTSHSSAAALDPPRMRQVVEQVLEAIDLDCLMVGFRESAEAFPLFCGPRRPVSDVFLWFGALSDYEGMDDSDLVVNWKGERSRGWGGWAEKGAEVEETFRFACPNNPAVRLKALRRLSELMRPLRLHRRLPRQDPVSFASERDRRAVVLLLRPLPPQGQGRRSGPRRRRQDPGGSRDRGAFTSG